jgi:Cys-rich repeat protein
MRRILFVFAAATVGGVVLTGCSDEECTTDADCAGYVCDFSEGGDTGVCLEECTSDAQCAAGFVCDTAEMACITPTTATCTADSQCGAYTCDTATGRCNTSCTDGSTCNDGYQCNADTSMCEVVAAVPYLFVAVTSEVPLSSDDANGPNPGPDIDAIVLMSGETTIPATTVAGGVIGVSADGENTRTTASDVTGARSAMTGDGPVFECNTDDGSGYYSLADNTGFVVVSFGAEIGDGDMITVYELDETNCSNLSTTRAEAYGVYVGQDAATATTAADVRNTWCAVGAPLAGGGTFSAAVDLSRCN